MSLLNDVLRDLQSRGAPEPRPLDGLAPVATVTSRSKWPLWSLAIVALGVAVLAWRPIAVAIAHDPQPAPTATVAADLPIATVPVADTPVMNTTAPVPATPVMDTKPADVTTPVSSPVAAELQRMPEPEADVPAAAAEPVIVRRQHSQAEDRTTPPLSSGLQALQSGDLAAAEQFFKDTLAINASDTSAWVYLYETQTRAAKVTAAEQTLRRSLSLASEPAELANLYARLLVARKETAQAIAILQDYRPTTTSDRDYDAFLAALLQQQGRFSDAGSLYRELLDRDPQPGAWWIGLAMSSDSLGDRAAALAAFERALRADHLRQPLANYARRRIAELENNG